MVVPPLLLGEPRPEVISRPAGLHFCLPAMTLAGETQNQLAGL